MTAPKFEMVQTPENALVIGNNNELIELLVQELISRGLETSVLTPASFTSQIASLDPQQYDHILFFWSTELAKWYSHEESRGPWAQFISRLSSHHQFLFLTHTSLQSKIPDLPGLATVCLYGDFLGQKSSEAPLINSFLSLAFSHQKISIPGDGLQDYHLLSLEDLVIGIARALMFPHRPNPLYLINPEAISLASLVYEIRSVLPHKILIDHQHQEVFPQPALDWPSILRSHSAINWKISHSPLENLSFYLRNFTPASAITRPTPQAPPSHSRPASSSRPKLKPLVTHQSSLSAPPPQKTPFKPPASPEFIPVTVNKPRKKLSKLKLTLPRRRLPSSLRIFLASLTFGLFLYFSVFLITATLTGVSIKNFLNRYTGNSAYHPPNSFLLRPSAVFLQANLTFLTRLPGLRNYEPLREANLLFSSYLLSLETLQSLQELALTGRNLTDYVLGEGEGDIVASLNLASLQADKLYDQLSLLDGSLPSSSPGILPDKYQAQYLVFKENLTHARRVALTGKTILSLSPDILGVGGRRKYLMLFQNNMELRPTGGFIGSFGIISLENGKLFDFSIQDIYTADGQLKGHVEPPEEIKKFLGEASWYMRDSNWDPDFPTSARRAEWFLQKSLNQTVDGTLAINVNTLGSILSALGPVNLEDYNEEVNSQNIYEKTEYHSEQNFFPGSTAKKEFISSVADTLIGKMRHLPEDQVLPLLKAMIETIDQKDTLISLGSDSTARALGTLGWNGELEDLPCPSLSQADDSPCLNDYAMLVDSNFGINKANYFIRRQINLDLVTTKASNLAHKLTVTYTNTAKTSAWPAGDYKNYSRLYLPLGSKLASVSLGNQKLPPSDIIQSVEHNRAVIGFLVRVPLDNTVDVVIEYTTPGRLIEGSSRYSFYWQKQPGTASDPLNITFALPPSLKPAIISPQAEYLDGQIKFGLTNITDRRITIKFE